jgi:uncharacterized protein YbjT (DUF2867 family)
MVSANTMRDRGSFCAAVARILIVGGGCRGRRLASELAGEGHALRVTSRRGAARASIEAAGAECWIGDPARLDTLRGALENVTLALWLLATASGSEHELRELHGPRLEAFVRQLIDTTVRGFVYESASDSERAGLSAAGERSVRSLAERNAIPYAMIGSAPDGGERWMAQMRAAVVALLGG